MKVASLKTKNMALVVFILSYMGFDMIPRTEGCWGCHSLNRQGRRCDARCEPSNGCIPPGRHPHVRTLDGYEEEMGTKTNINIYHKNYFLLYSL